MERIRFGGFLAGSRDFDAAAFGITSAEAELMDPQQRVLMEVVSFHLTRILFKIYLFNLKMIFSKFHFRSGLTPTPSASHLPKAELLASSCRTQVSTGARHGSAARSSKKTLQG